MEPSQEPLYPNFLNLPDEILYKIFVGEEAGADPRVNQVSKEWKGLIDNVF